MGKGICLCLFSVTASHSWQIQNVWEAVHAERTTCPITLHVPPSGVKSNFTLRSEHGCFTWYLLALLTWPLLCIEC